jgi:hypothetical protein
MSSLRFIAVSPSISLSGLWKTSSTTAHARDYIRQDEAIGKALQNPTLLVKKLRARIALATDVTDYVMATRANATAKLRGLPHAWKMIASDGSQPATRGFSD